jgi:hypothetical protein
MILDLFFGFPLKSLSLFTMLNAFVLFSHRLAEGGDEEEMSDFTSWETSDGSEIIINLTWVRSHHQSREKNSFLFSFKFLTSGRTQSKLSELLVRNSFCHQLRCFACCFHSQRNHFVSRIRNYHKLLLFYVAESKLYHQD